IEPGGAKIWQVDAPQPLETVLKVLLADSVMTRGGLLLHSVGLGRTNAAVLVGPSGAGKSTLGGFAASVGLVRLADELVAVLPTDRGYIVEGTPWNIGTPTSRPLAWLGTQSFSPDNLLEPGSASDVLRVMVSNMLVANPSAEGRHAAFQNASR